MYILFYNQVNDSFSAQYLYIHTERRKGKKIITQKANIYRKIYIYTVIQPLFDRSREIYTIRPKNKLAYNFIIQLHLPAESHA